MYSSILHWSFQICSHMHPKSFDAGLSLKAPLYFRRWHRSFVEVLLDSRTVGIYFTGLITILIHLPLLLHICIGKLAIIGSGNALSPVQHQAITWSNADLLSFGSLGINFSKILIKIQNFSSWKCIWKCCLWNGGHLAKGELTGQKIKQTE